MKAVLLDVPASLLEQRRRRGLDKRDERWDGVLHMVPPPSRAHQVLAQAVFRVLAPLAEPRGLVPLYETGLFAAADDHRVPDQLYARDEELDEVLRSRVLACRLRTVEGRRLRIEWEGGAAEV